MDLNMSSLQNNTINVSPRGTFSLGIQKIEKSDFISAKDYGLEMTETFSKILKNMPDTMFFRGATFCTKGLFDLLKTKEGDRPIKKYRDIYLGSSLLLSNREENIHPFEIDYFDVVDFFAFVHAFFFEKRFVGTVFENIKEFNFVVKDNDFSGLFCVSIHVLEGEEKVILFYERADSNTPVLYLPEDAYSNMLVLFRSKLNLRP